MGEADVGDVTAMAFILVAGCLGREGKKNAGGNRASKKNKSSKGGFVNPRPGIPKRFLAKAPSPQTVTLTFSLF